MAVPHTRQPTLTWLLYIVLFGFASLLCGPGWPEVPIPPATVSRVLTLQTVPPGSGSTEFL